MKMAKFFLYSAALILLVTGVSKFLSGLGNAGMLQAPDPIFKLPFRYVLIGAAVAELVVATICIISDRLTLKAGLVAFLATNFALYRLGLPMAGYHGHCLCLGNLTDAIHIPPDVADAAMKVILGYLLVGSYVVLFLLKWRSKNLVAAPDKGQ